ncbi:23S rRNA (pseudouridine(1915)-N(3))-methyltransferase RlmH [Brevundimonas sp. S30B]|uniref:23S rRNA (pseudouridine(1915)-N(3))-methyltransferase RlmH n=1 Tax=unclassified Brevundimonas TaxID=2622653 RepID=UPI001071932E|nr:MULTISPECIES: 23S rRNA (pseudouridine(1915)-N(3))-methyltransferase RlmH [unclassified Brevundimonas]QBX36599.1 23S rRNA (pseudouridine(1915)-N(3))-methyltransferase RlmH [Brevundimonas sp. MF30-B]TFW00898.1 23S rRNA (pseudouridine(1915)-N(3))-methyltransferase RlmH [Brevundimonas sp. S30B]
MKLSLIAIGKPGRGPEAALADDYARRATLAGRPLGLGPLELIDLEPRKPGKAPEAELILGAAEGAHLIACDERGKAWSSRAFAEHLALLRDRGERRLAFAIGGADGLDESVRARAGSLLAFGPQTWPHALARAMLAEQLYRAVTILAGSPYHRD